MLLHQYSAYKPQDARAAAALNATIPARSRLQRKQPSP